MSKDLSTSQTLVHNTGLTIDDLRTITDVVVKLCDQRGNVQEMTLPPETTQEFLDAILIRN